MAIESVPHRLRFHASTRPHADAYFERTAAGWKATSWKDYAAEVEQAGRAMIALGVEFQDAPAIIGFNCASWVIAFLGANMIGGKPTGIYTTNSPQELQYVVDHAESPILFIEDEVQWKKVEAVRDQLPNLKHVVLFRGHPKIAGADALTWDEFLAHGTQEHQEELLDRLQRITKTDIGSLIYTSGTTGPPKAVMITHGNLMATAEIARQLVDATTEDRVLSYLPLSHIAEQVFSVHGPIFWGFSTYFATSLEELPMNLQEVQPTILFGVPRVWEKVYDGITSKLSQATGVKKALADWALGVGQKSAPYRMKGEVPPGLLGMQFKLANKLIFSKVKEAIGLSSVRVAVSGAAPIVPEVIEFFLSLDVVIQEVYGQSEDTGPTCFNRIGAMKLGTVGRPVPGLELRIADDGEIMIRGANVFPGYLKNEEATRETLTPDGWLHTGDIGVQDADGYVTITGRKKEILITAGGKNIAPANVEAALKRHPFINEAVLIGDNRRYITALLTMEPERVESWASEKNVSPEAALEHDAFHAMIQAHVDEINKEFATVEQVKKFTIIGKNFTVEDGQLTPSLKVKRRVIYEQYSSEIESMYG